MNSFLHCMSLIVVIKRQIMQIRQPALDHNSKISYWNQNHKAHVSQTFLATKSLMPFFVVPPWKGHWNKKNDDNNSSRYANSITFSFMKAQRITSVSVPFFEWFYCATPVNMHENPINFIFYFISNPSYTTPHPKDQLF